MTELIAHLTASNLAGVAVAGGLALLLALVLAARTFRRISKLTAGTAVVQAGVTVAVITGTYEFCVDVFGMPWWEAAAMAVFFEAATWVTVGMVRAHTADKDAVGFGPAGPFFWLFSALGGLLAVIAGDTPGEMVGRAVVVILGACLWYLTLLLRATRRETRGSLRWTPRRMLIAVGAIEPGDADVADANREWQVRRLARSMRWANSRAPWSWLGRRGLVRLSETTRESVIVQARRRYAVGLLATSTVRPDSTVMRAVLADVRATHMAATGTLDEALGDASSEAGRDALLEAHREASRRATNEADHEALDEASPDPADEASSEAQREALSRALTSEHAVRLAKLRERAPDITQDAAIKRLKVSRATVQRYWAHTAPAGAKTTVNGKRI